MSSCMEGEREGRKEGSMEIKVRERNERTMKDKKKERVSEGGWNGRECLWFMMSGDG